MLGGCWTLLDILLDAPEPRVAAGTAERSAESARRVASACRHGWHAVLVATWSATGVGERRTVTTVRLPWTLLMLGSRVVRRRTAGASVGRDIHAF